MGNSRYRVGILHNREITDVFNGDTGDTDTEIIDEERIVFFGAGVPEHGEFDIPGFQLVDMSANRCRYKIIMEEYEPEIKKNDSYFKCKGCKGYNCRYTPSRKLDVHKEDEV